MDNQPFHISWDLSENEQMRPLEDANEQLMSIESAFMSESKAMLPLDDHIQTEWPWAHSNMKLGDNALYFNSADVDGDKEIKLQAESQFGPQIESKTNFRFEAEHS